MLVHISGGGSGRILRRGIAHYWWGGKIRCNRSSGGSLRAEPLALRGASTAGNKLFYATGKPARRAGTIDRWCTTEEGQFLLRCHCVPASVTRSEMQREERARVERGERNWREHELARTCLHWHAAL